MLLAEFITALTTTGDVTIARVISAFQAPDLKASTEVLKTFYAQEVIELPGLPPDFNPKAAVWAAQYLYHATQLALLRQFGGAKIPELLPPFPGKEEDSAALSSDLCLRHLPNLVQLARGLAPDDPLVLELYKTARAWPLSSVGMGKLILDETYVFKSQHPTLRYLYADRIIEKKDKELALFPANKELIQERLGDHANEIWPDIKDYISNSNEISTL